MKEEKRISLAGWKKDITIIAFIVLVAFTIRYISISDVGVTSDEPIYLIASLDYIYGIQHFNFSDTLWSVNMEHPPVSKYIYGTAIWLTQGFSSYTYDDALAAKTASAIMGVLSCIIVYLIGRDFFDRRTGVAAALVLALVPEFVAHTQTATLESPLILLVSLTMYTFMWSVKKDSENIFVAAAILFGLVLGTKYNGLLILPVMGIIFLLHNLSRIKNKTGKLDGETLSGNIGTIIPVTKILIFAGIVVMTFFIIWPWLWSNPAGHMTQSLNHWTYTVQEYFLGVQQAPPLYYYPLYFIVTLPALLFLPLVLGAVEAAKSKDAFKIGVLLWFVIPFAYNFSSFILDGMRYIMLIYPAVALLCGYGIVRLARVAARWLERQKITEKEVFYGLTGITGIYLLITAAFICPYYLDYYNGIVGGPQNVQEHKLFKFSWWGEGIKESMDWVNDHARQGSTVMMLATPEDPANTQFFTGDMRYIYPWMSQTDGKNKEYNFTARPYVINSGNETVQMVPDYVIYNFEMKELLNITFNDTSYTEVYSPKAGGAPLVYVYRNNNIR